MLNKKDLRKRRKPHYEKISAVDTLHQQIDAILSSPIQIKSEDMYIHEAIFYACYDELKSMTINDIREYIRSVDYEGAKMSLTNVLLKNDDYSTKTNTDAKASLYLLLKRNLPMLLNTLIHDGFGDDTLDGILKYMNLVDLIMYAPKIGVGQAEALHKLYYYAYGAPFEK